MAGFDKRKDFKIPRFFQASNFPPSCGAFSAIRQRLAVASGTLPDRSRGGPTESA
jgi:hypothetical protein